jgi:hypothetical protein
MQFTAVQLSGTKASAAASRDLSEHLIVSNNCYF